MMWIKACCYLVVISIGFYANPQNSHREYTQEEKAVLSELCGTVSLDMIKSDEVKKEELCFFSHGLKNDKFVPFKKSILKHLTKQGVKAYPSSAMDMSRIWETDKTGKKRKKQETAYVLDGTSLEGRLYVIKFKSFDENTASFTAYRLKGSDMFERRYKLKKTGNSWGIQSKVPVIY
ncbi:hypothetical protein Pan241w_37060 [Gimesia alba]|uniref:Uncharacterized protein n=1 Tax=Gimesia alba TaxID=2527973 RepID=A0A517RI94_9PLAN|nr:hypothetical protein [Gimesia alba]QDT43604.1 hypothetical protein Pan241w_37060 [Gimesia alba]